MAYVSIRELRKSYDDTEALHGLNLGFEEGEFVVIVGPSGCGKSTLLRMIAGLESVTSGEIAIAGQVVNDFDPADRGCAMVFQNYALYPHMTVAANIGYPLKLAKLPRTERDARVRQVAEILGLTPYLDRRPKQLSGGQRQRVAMGRAIVREPRLFLFDEPLSNLDAKMRVQMRIELRRLHRQLSATSVLVTHDQIEAMTMADRLVVMNSGRIEQIGPPSEVYARPASTFVAGFLGSPAMNLFTARIGAEGGIQCDLAPDREFPGRLDLAPGSAFVLGVRPEDMSIAETDTSGLPAVLDLIEDLGGTRIAHCRVGEAFVTAVLPRESRLREGARLGLLPGPRQLHAFSLETGLRLTSTATAGTLAPTESVTVP
ncbi:ABC transporter ATP-binding protein [Paracoccus alkanivorans]|uniref:sn-glycerol-3-phosphate ABC transporter ATP-binding protein UgpC n=1 Tax=Paracoccus alkanivorans TaxID=2116655 RepID=A0A3M0M412_9RHOB|nr:sn-glycerol-3-phosphate ABC transporter ATP-binding protein UgpC [Paracoccus alkanivorans]RMC30190.1 sn-glycerol-3-phosphate ABC transporter ATP-binding protein UgpC [Paracoccus alkanivorans]